MMVKRKKNPRQFREVKSPIASTIESKVNKTGEFKPGNQIYVGDFGNMLIDSIKGGSITLLGRLNEQIVRIANHPVTGLERYGEAYEFKEHPETATFSRLDSAYHIYQSKLRSAKI